MLRWRGRMRCFNSRSRMGSDAWQGRRPAHRPRFNSRSRMGSDLNRRKRGFQFRGFNSRSRMGSDPRLRGWLRGTLQFQFTLPHGERLDLPGAVGQGDQVSIHAPAWGATITDKNASTKCKFQFTLPHGERPLVRLPREVSELFQFTLPHGERPRRRDAPQSARGFNSRSRMGSDTVHRALRILRDVSIHAPAWGATSSGSSASSPNPFQFTLPHGERRGVSVVRLSSGRFNSRSRMGSDNRPPRRGGPWRRFNSRSRMGSDSPRSRPRRPPESFNSRSRMGSDLFLSVALTAGHCFNSRSRMGSDPRPLLRPVTRRVSIHAPAWGATPPKQYL